MGVCVCIYISHIDLDAVVNVCASIYMLYVHYMDILGSSKLTS